MKILQICHKAPFPDRDGGTIAEKSFLECLVSQGNKVDVLTPSTSKHPVELNQIPDWFKKQGRFYYFTLNNNINLFYLIICLIASKSYILNRYQNKKFLNILQQICKHNKYDLVILDGMYAAVYFNQIKQLTSAKIIYRAHNVEHKIWQLQLKNTSFLKRIYLAYEVEKIKEFEKKLAKNVHAVLPISTTDLQFFKPLNKNSKLLPFTIKTFLQKPKSINNANQCVFGFIGALNWKPNVDGLIWFLQNVWQPYFTENNNVKFYIAGRNQPKTLKNLNVKGVINHGEVAQSSDFFSKINVLVVPLFSGSGVRIKILEAMSLQIPVLASDVAINGIEVTPNLEFLSANTAMQFKTEMEKLASNITLRQTIGKNAQNKIEKMHNSANQAVILQNYLTQLNA